MAESPDSWNANGMAFQENYWVVVGTAAPVVALASVIVVGDALRLVAAGPDSLEHVQKGTWRWAASRGISGYLGRWVLLLGFANLVIQTATLLLALLSLDWRRNALPTPVPDAALVFGLLAVASFTAATAWLRFQDY